MTPFLKLAARAMRRSRHLRQATALQRAGRPARALIAVAAFHREDGTLLTIMRKRKAEYAHLAEVVAALEAAGAGEFVQGYYLPVGALFFSDTLELCLALQRGETDVDTCVRWLREYFANGRLSLPRAAFTPAGTPRHEAG